MAVGAFSTLFFNNDGNQTFSVNSTSQAFSETTHSSNNFSISREEAAWLSVTSFRSGQWSTASQGEGSAVTISFQTSQSPSPLDQLVDGEALIPEGCREAFGEFLPWKNSRNIISARTASLTLAFVYCGVFPILSLVGALTNFLSCAVFYRLGVKRGINLCLLLLSLSDQLFLLSKTPIWFAKVVVELLHDNEGVRRWNHIMVSYHIARKPVIFLFFSNFLTMLASLDRCVSIVSPLKARLIFTHKVVVTVITSALIVIVSSNVFIGFQVKTQCVYNTQEKSVLWGIGASELYRSNKEVFDFVDNIVLVFGFPFLSISVVIVSTSVIIQKLNKALRWRQTCSVRGEADYRSSNRAETQLNKMLIVVSFIHVVCTIPAISKDVVRFVNPDFNVFGHYGNLFLAAIAWKDAAAAINCTVNFFVYHTLSSQFRHTLSAMLGRRSAKTSTNTTTTSVISAPSCTSASESC